MCQARFLGTISEGRQGGAARSGKHLKVEKQLPQCRNSAEDWD